LGIDGVPLAVCRDRFDVEDQIVVPRPPHDQFDIGSPRYGDLPIAAAHIIRDSAVVNAAIA
jgi:hypothetical protein